ncbi:MAG: copper-binding protein [Betaproteobacteria bacterium]|nr:copper-binding protein [Betaproteobacteria bacterium]
MGKQATGQKRFRGSIDAGAALGEHPPHGPVESLKWPAMTMEFKLPNAALREDH